MASFTRSPRLPKGGFISIGPMSLPGGVLQRKCACGQHATGGECEECGKKKRELQRKKGDRPEPAGVPTVVYQVLRSSGRPLDAATRGRMEQRFGQDFSGVRVHSNARAAESARSVNALAYTVGRNIVFGAGQYAPETDQGSRLLAHELVHVRQQDRAGIASAPAKLAVGDADSAAEREARSIEQQAPKAPFRSAVAVASPQVQRAPNAALKVDKCSGGQKDQISGAIAAARPWVQQTAGLLASYPGSAQKPAGPAVGPVLKEHFGSTEARIVAHVRARVKQLQRDMNDLSSFTLTCRTEAEDPDCKKPTAAYAAHTSITFCPFFFELDRDRQAEAFVHELMHTQMGKVADRGYVGERVFPYLTIEERLTNADTYAAMISRLGSGKATARKNPEDTEEDCAPWASTLREAIARVEVWNRLALKGAKDLAVANLSPKQVQYLGGKTQADIDRAVEVFHKMQERLQKKVDFECEPEGGGRCKGNTATYWFAVGDFHICPTWTGKKSVAERVLFLLSGLYGYFDFVDEPSRRSNYALLTQELASTTDPLPSLNEILGSPQWTPDLIAIRLKVYQPEAAAGDYVESGTAHDRLSAKLPVLGGCKDGATPPEFRAQVYFETDTAGVRRPAPFALPTIGISVTSGKHPLPKPGSDAKPIYITIQSKPRLIPRPETYFAFSPTQNDTLKIEFSISDPDSGVKRVYSDTIRIEEPKACQTSPVGAPSSNVPEKKEEPAPPGGPARR